MYSLIIIGGGPAGITAGIYAARKKLNTLLIAKDFIGQIGKAWGVENYPGFEKISGLDLIQRFKSHLKKFEIDIRENDEVKEIQKKDDNFEVATKTGKNYLAKAVIIASGRDPRPLEIPGEKEFIGRGLSYCVTCDGPLFAGKTVAVIGGGNAGFETAFELLQHCPKIYILEFGERAKADEVNQERAKQSGKIEVITNAVVNEIQGKTFVDSIVYQDKKTKEIKTLNVEGVFVEIGSLPATSFVKGLVDFDEYDQIKIDPKTNETSTPGLFAAGDVTDINYKQVIIACGEGAKAALSAYEYLQKIED
jgi:thioredoxin-disulfide reductase